MKLKYDYPGYKAAVRVLAHKSEHTYEDVIDAVAAVLSVIEHERGQDPAEWRDWVEDGDWSEAVTIQELLEDVDNILEQL